MLFFLFPIFLCLTAFIVVTTASSSDCPQPPYRQLPPAAQSPAISNVTGYRVEAFGNGAYMVTDGLYQAMFLVACKSVIVVDNPPTIGTKMLDAIRTTTSLPISHVIYSHAHADHIGGAYLLAHPNVTIIAQRLTAEELAIAPDPSHRPQPTITFESSYRLQVCNQTLDLIYGGPNHEPGNIFIYAPVQKVLMLVDVVYPGWVPFENLAESQNIPGWIKAHDQILYYDFDHYVAGHLGRSGNRTDVEIAREYVHDLYDNCLEAINLSAAPPNDTNPISAQTLLPPVESAYPGNGWAAFNAYLTPVVGYCNNKTTAKWIDRLGGADVFGFSNANAMLESLRIDYGFLGPFGVAP